MYDSINKTLFSIFFFVLVTAATCPPAAGVQAQPQQDAVSSDRPPAEQADQPANSSSQPSPAPTHPAGPAPDHSHAQKPQTLTLAGAAMCERIENLTPINQAVTFPVSIGQVYCLTNFDPVPQGTHIFHRWYHLGDLSTKIKLRLQSPRWTTFSTIQLREADKGPWRVEVTDQDGKVFTVLRFSITD